MFVMIGAISVYALLLRTVVKKQNAQKSDLVRVDRKLVVGAALFGVGWGATGLCPGPGLVGMISGTAYSLIFVGTMLIGMLVGASISKRKLLNESPN